MLYANTDDGSSALWVCDGSGVVVDNISIYGAERAPILEQINEHYGTSFTGWSDNEMGLRFGDTVPNWDAYEKIEMEQIKVAINVGSAQYIFGNIEGNEFIVSITSSDYCNVCTNEGVIVYPQGGPLLDDNIINMIKYRLSAYNIENVSSMIESYEQNQEVDNWDEYTIIE